MLYAIACVHVTNSKAALSLDETATSTCHSFQCQHNIMLIVTAYSVLLSSQCNFCYYYMFAWKYFQHANAYHIHCKQYTYSMY